MTGMSSGTITAPKTSGVDSYFHRADCVKILAGLEWAKRNRVGVSHDGAVSVTQIELDLLPAEPAGKNQSSRPPWPGTINRTTFRCPPRWLDEVGGSNEFIPPYHYIYCYQRLDRYTISDSSHQPTEQVKSPYPLTPLWSQHLSLPSHIHPR